MIPLLFYSTFFPEPKPEGHKIMCEHFLALKKAADICNRREETLCSSPHSRVSGTNQQICFAAKERSCCENIREKSFKTSETHQVEKDGSIFPSRPNPLYSPAPFQHLEEEGWVRQRDVFQFLCRSPFLPVSVWDWTSLMIWDSTDYDLKLWYRSLLQLQAHTHRASVLNLACNKRNLTWFQNVSLPCCCCNTLSCGWGLPLEVMEAWSF